MTYQFEVTIKTESTPKMFLIKRTFENKYQAQTELTNIGKNGLIINENGQKYFPPHRILEIDFKEIN